jgi:hypothetical protein
MAEREPQHQSDRESRDAFLHDDRKGQKTKADPKIRPCSVPLLP